MPGMQGHREKLGQISVAINIVARIILTSSPPDVPAQAFDARRIVITEKIGATVLITYDRFMAAGSGSIGIKVARFI